MNISFLTSGHLPYDDRIFYHLGKTLTGEGYNVEIVSSKILIREMSEGISVNCFDGDTLRKSEKTKQFIKYLEVFNPQLIICSEPLPLISAYRFKKNGRKGTRIVYDITEWYPLTNSSIGTGGLKRLPAFIRFLFLDLLSSFLADAFIFGEWHKSRHYRFLFPFKPYTFITYYTDLKYFKKTEPTMSEGLLRLTYSGRISRERGLVNFFKVVRGLAARYPDTRFMVKVIGWYESEKDKAECEPYLQESAKNIFITLTGRESYTGFIDMITGTDLFIDLRENNFENRFSLPIKLFNYLAVGRPVIYSDSKGVRRVKGFEKFGHLVKPQNTDVIIQMIAGYIDNTALYKEHCRNARKASEEYFNWQIITPELLRFIRSLSPTLPGS
jgi:glycosyltransferase involved in cell wall biosynthesis